MKTKTKQLDLRPIAAVAKKHAKKSIQVGHFSKSEGYEIVRLCFADKVKVQFNPATQGSSFNAEMQPESVTQGQKVIAAIAHELRQSGYKVHETDALTIIVEGLK
jgi:hypothetical protein